VIARYLMTHLIVMLNRISEVEEKILLAAIAEEANLVFNMAQHPYVHT
jgi:hypothetical protein